MTEEGFMRIASEKMLSEFERILLGIGFSQDRAMACAQVFMVNSLEGVYSHG
jgi:3-dehydro-L-gulonate 2-dehydrogenase